MGLRIGDIMPSNVLSAWGLSLYDEASKLYGGSNRSIRVGSVVYKPVDDIMEAEWCQECLSRLVPDDFRIAEPLRSSRGNWVESGWMASRWVDGVAGPKGHWDQILEISARFHRALSLVTTPIFLGQRSHRWAVADRVAWKETSIKWLPETINQAHKLDELWEPLDLPVQAIHGDLSGNVLFAAGLTPAVIDFSPYWRPAAFADAVILMDGMLWYAWDDILPLVPLTRTFLQLLVRAALFRLGALNERARRVDSDSLRELPTFDRVILWLSQNIRRSAVP
jgi:uncharacterized protein (TIGR02569 family)